MSNPTKRFTQVFTKDPHISSVAAGVLLRRRLHKMEWKRKIAWRDSIVKKVVDAGIPLMCEFCGRPKLIPFYKKKRSDGLTLDHFIPYSRSKDNRLSNLVLSCSSCNSTKSDRMPTQKEIESVRTIEFLLNNSRQLETV